jgi:hypothetical protein
VAPSNSDNVYILFDILFYIVLYGLTIVVILLVYVFYLIYIYVVGNTSHPAPLWLYAVVYYRILFYIVLYGFYIV